MIRDTDIRQRLHLTELQKYKSNPEVMVIDELGLCQGLTRVDIAVVNGSMIGYEIKSELDTLERLPAQRDLYNKILDYVIIVSYTSHIQYLDDCIPDWWGIIEVKKTEESFDLISRKKPKKNRQQDNYSIAQLLWKEEALNLLIQLDLATGLKNKPRNVLWNRLAESLSTFKLSKLVRETIRARGNWRADLSLR